MESAGETFGKEKSHSNHESRQDSFEQHLERMRTFRKAHDLAESKKTSGTPDASHARIEPVAPESRELLSKLLLAGYVLHLINERGTVTLPQNWQN